MNAVNAVNGSGITSDCSAVRRVGGRGFVQDAQTLVVVVDEQAGSRRGRQRERRREQRADERDDVGVDEKKRVDRQAARGTSA